MPLGLCQVLRRLGALQTLRGVVTLLESRLYWLWMSPLQLLLARQIQYGLGSRVYRAEHRLGWLSSIVFLLLGSAGMNIAPSAFHAEKQHHTQPLALSTLRQLLV